MTTSSPKRAALAPSRSGPRAGATEAGATALTRLAEIPVHEVNRVGEKRAEALAALGIDTVLDLVTHYPRRYIDRTRRADVVDMQVGQESLVMATVTSARSRRTRQGRTIVELDVDDGTGSLRVTFFNQPWRTRQLPSGTEALFFGKLDTYRGRRQLTNPVVDLVGNRTGRIVPVYPTSERSGIAGWEFGEWVAEALRRAGELLDPVPAAVREELDLDGRTEAFAAIHAPETFDAQRRARRRLAFDELLRLQLEVGMRRQALARDARGIRHVVDPEGSPDLVAGFLAQLPFPLTGAQQRAVAEIGADLAGELPMHRLLQGDVGSGKTVVALSALLTGVQGGHQGALMAPTEVLAEQHHLSVRALLADLVVPDPGRLGGSRPLEVALLTNRTPASERTRLHEGLVSGAVDIVVGTHALLTDDVRFADLGVVVIDEQHRFGVEQRDVLRAKGRHGASGPGADPDVLVMTATPIPRTAAMVFFGDLEVTELDELPAGRTAVRTTWARAETDEEAAWQCVRTEVAAGNRAYVVCPLVEGSERVQARSATHERELLEAGALAGLRLGLLHGQMKAADKEGVMAGFRAGDLDVLVATTVIEVGVDVPEATVMVVLDAERFGIAQLHQLRGRVGRSERPSHCWLLSSATTPEAAARLQALEGSTDGFDLADVDLELRGEGTILGTRQKGRSDLKLASLRRGDRPLVEEARRVATALLEDDPLLARQGVLADEVRLFVGDDAGAFLRKS
jgi:ATP-dependent DNA helicase RecG